MALGDRIPLLLPLILIAADPPCRPLTEGEAIVEVYDVQRSEWHPLWCWGDAGTEVQVFPSVAAAQRWADSRNRDRYAHYEIKTWIDGRLRIANAHRAYRVE